MMVAETLQINIKGLFDPMKHQQFQEYLNYVLSKDQPLNYHDFQKNVGLSRRQWDMFRELNVDSKLAWVNE